MRRSSACSSQRLWRTAIGGEAPARWRRSICCRWAPPSASATSSTQSAWRRHRRCPGSRRRTPAGCAAPPAHPATPAASDRPAAAPIRRRPHPARPENRVDAAAHGLSTRFASSVGCCATGVRSAGGPRAVPRAARTAARRQSRRRPGARACNPAEPACVGVARLTGDHVHLAYRLAAADLAQHRFAPLGAVKQGFQPAGTWQMASEGSP
jgi:hypothetical protein